MSSYWRAFCKVSANKIAHFIRQVMKELAEDSDEVVGNTTTDTHMSGKPDPPEDPETPHSPSYSRRFGFGQDRSPSD
jgi:hypothetical protein